MKHVVVLGAGKVGGVIASDLALDPRLRVTVVDPSEEGLAAVRGRLAGSGAEESLTAHRGDATDAALLGELAGDCAAFVGALPSHLGFGALRTVLGLGRPYCDISFMAQDAWDLDALAREKGTTAVVDFGVAPGMSNLLAGHAVGSLDSARSVAIYVGGVPRDPRPPHYFKAAFAPRDVVEEYVRPARIVENGELVVRPPLSDPEVLTFDGIGTLEAFNTDGLRSLATTLDVPDMKEKTLRHPEHAALMRQVASVGLLGEGSVETEEGTVSLPALLKAVFAPAWEYEEGEEDLTVMRIVVEGREDGAEVRHTWDLVDTYDAATATTSMARTTAFPCALMARELALGGFQRPGVVTPEQVADEPGLVDRILAGLAERGVRYGFTRTAL